MNTTPDTTITEAIEEAGLEDALLDALSELATDPSIDNVAEHLLIALSKPLAAIRRQAAADALKEQARRINKQASFYEEMRRSAAEKGDTASYETWSVHASQARNDATSCLQAAKDKITEGYEHVCAAYTWATRSDPGYGCDERVPDAGDYCSKHEPEDDEDRWAE